LKDKFGIEIVAWVSSVGDIEIPTGSKHANSDKITRQDVDAHITRCPDPSVQEEMAAVRT
jgi:chorismate synthase